MRREFPDAPIVGVGAVVIEGNRVLLVRRGREPLKGEWSLPGGAVELGETLEEAIGREVAEETGVEVRVLQLVEVLDRIVREDTPATRSNENEDIPAQQKRAVRYHYVLIDFLCSPAGGVLRSASDADDARWVAREELNSHSIYRLAPIALAIVEKAFRILRPDPKPGAGK